MFPPESLPEMGSSAKDLNTKGEEYQLLAEMMAQGMSDIGKICSAYVQIITECCV